MTDNSAKFERARKEANIELSGDDLLDELARKPPLEYDRIRGKMAKKMGVRTSILDDEVNKRRLEMKEDTDSPLSTITPWEKRVSGDKLLRRSLDQLLKYIVMPKASALTACLWTIHSHAHDAFDVSPILCISSPEKGSGKSTTLSVIQNLVPRPLLAANITHSALFRCIEKWKPTLLIDEADTFLEGNDELRGVLNSGHHRDRAFVVRCVGDDHDARRFGTWAPKAIALNGQLPATLHDRAIELQMKRRLPTEHIEPLPRDGEQFSKLAGKMARWAADHMEELEAIDPAMPDGFINRRADNWRPLLAIAEVIGGDWPTKAREAAMTLESTRQDDDTAGILLLKDIRRIFKGTDTKRMHTRELIEGLVRIRTDRTWAEWSNGKPISPGQVAKLLRPFRIHSKQISIDGHNRNGYVRRDFRDMGSRYTSD